MPYNQKSLYLLVENLLMIHLLDDKLIEKATMRVEK